MMENTRKGFDNRGIDEGTLTLFSLVASIPGSMI